MNVLVTGANRGIGKSLFDAYRTSGTDVIGTARSAGEPFLSLDVTDAMSFDHLGQALAGKVIDLLICNAGIYPDKGQNLSTGYSPEMWASAFATNVTGAKEKLAAVLEATSLSDEDLGAFLRSKGLHEVQLQQWRDQMLAGLEPMTAPRGKKAPEGKRVRELEKELRRKDKALAETATLLVLKKKAQTLWGDEDDDTDN